MMAIIISNKFILSEPLYKDDFTRYEYTCKQKKKKSSLRQNIAEDHFLTIAIKVFCFFLLESKMQTFRESWTFFLPSYLRSLCRNCSFSRVPLASFPNGGTTRAGVALWIC